MTHGDEQKPSKEAGAQKDKTESKGLDPEYVFWLVENRSATQAAAARLYKLLTEHKAKLASSTFNDDAQLLVGTAFSLWRAVFLAGDENNNRYDTAIAFLGEVLQNNAIAYPQEFRNKDWTFRYYANNASYRLFQFAQVHGNAEIQKLLHPLNLLAPPKQRWPIMQQAFDLAISDFEKRLLATQQQ